VRVAFWRITDSQLGRAGLLGGGLLAALLACGPASPPAPETVSADPSGTAAAPGEPADPSRLRLSDGGLYRVSLRPASGEIPLGQIHPWILHVETLEGESFTPSRITVGGGMPQHSHGFMTDPRVTKVLGNGDFLVEGVKFHMSGDWVLRFEIVGARSGDIATFDVSVEP